MTDIKIEKGIPIPETRSKGTSIYPFENMEVGDSFFAPNKTRQQMDNACGHWRKAKGWKFTLQFREEEQHDGHGASVKVSGTRVWRKE